MSDYSREELEKKAIEIVRGEKTAWETGTTFVTDKVAFQTRNLIRQVRKNYWGVFDKPTDPYTKREKVWIPLTEVMVENAIKNFDLDTKDIGAIARHPDNTRLAGIIRQYIIDYLDEDEFEYGVFGENLDDLERRTAIDGTGVWKTVEDEKRPKVINIDLLNTYLDPNSRNIQSAYRFTERCLLTKSELMKMSQWVNTEKAESRTNIAPTDSFFTYTGSTFSTSKFVDVWEMWGKIPKSIITGVKEDEKDEVEGRIVVSGLDTGGGAQFHYAAMNKAKGYFKKPLKPYEEVWYRRVPNRWHGRGIGEMLMMLQIYVNTIVNIRINRSYTSQLGLFKIRRGSGITPLQLQNLSANGAMLVNDPSDIEQLVMQEASQASYTDEANINTWAQRVTSAFESVTGEKLPSSTTATTSAIQQQGGQAEFTKVREGFGFFLARWLRRHCFPIMEKYFQPSIVSITGDLEDLNEFDEGIVNNMLYDKLLEMSEAGQYLNSDQVEQERQRLLAHYKSLGKNRYVKLKELKIFDYHVSLQITNEKLDKSALIQNLTAVLNVVPELRDQIVQQVFDTLGLSYKAPKTPPAPLPGAPKEAMPNVMPNQIPNANLQKV